VEYQNVCYLIHFDKPVNGAGHQHYIGFTSYLPDRIASHRASTSSGLTGRANRAGIPWRVVRVWRNADIASEKALKHLGGVNLCPICSKFMSKSKSIASRSENEVMLLTAAQNSHH